jgi:hypothetical protein
MSPATTPTREEIQWIRIENRYRSRMTPGIVLVHHLP